MSSARSQLAALPVIPRFALAGAAFGLVAGGIVGLILGLRAHPATAWFAVLEVGIPGAICGALLGALGGLLAAAVQRFQSDEP